MIVLDREELAWAAGLFDGEGTVTRRNRNNKSGHRGQPSLQVGQTDREVLDRFHKAVGEIGHVYGPYEDKRPNRKRFWLYCAFDLLMVQAVIALLWRHLGSVKRAQAIRILRLYNFPVAGEDKRPRRIKTAINSRLQKGANERFD